MAAAAIQQLDQTNVHGKIIRVRQSIRKQEQHTTDHAGQKTNRITFNLAVHRGVKDAFPHMHKKIQNRIEELSNVHGASAAAATTSNRYEVSKVKLEEKLAHFLFEEFPVEVDVTLSEAKNQSETEELAQLTPGVAEEPTAPAPALASSTLNTASTSTNGEAEKGAASFDDTSSFDDDVGGYINNNTNGSLYEESVEDQVRNTESTLELVELFGILG